MDPNQPIPPSPSAPQQGPSGMPPMAGAPQGHRTNNPNDLYAQITAEDEEVVVAPKKKTTPIISIVAVFMKITFWVDELRRSHERFFILLHTIWACFMGVLYSAGLITLFLSVFSFMQLPVYLERYFSERGIQYDSLEMADYSFSKINVINLRDQNNTYNIPQIVVHSTFADFLQNRIRMIEANSLSINLAPNAQAGNNDLNLLIKLLQAFSNPKRTGLELDINVIRINNATLNIQGQNYTVPISFSLSGTYMGDNQLVVPFSINKDFLNIDASLEVTGPENARQIKIKTNKPGSLTLPQRPKEELQGEVNIQMQDQKIQTMELSMLLNYVYSLKTIRATLQRNDQDTFDGSLLFTMGDSSDGTYISNPTTDVTLNFKELSLTPEKKLVTSKPLWVNLRRFVHQDTIIEGLDTTLNGELVCSVNDMGCVYTLKENTPLSMQNLQLNVKGQPVHFNQNPSLTVLPAQKESIQLQLNSPYLQLEAPIQDAKLTGTFGEKNEKLSFTANDANLQMTLAQKASDTHFKILIQNANYQSADLSMNHINMLIDDYFDETGKVQFSSDHIQTNSNLLKKPISLEITNVGTQSAIRAQAIDTNLVLNAQGYFDPFKFAFSGRFAIPVLDLDNLPFSLSEFSSVFSENISNLTGQFAASGQLKVNGLSNISGPFYMSLKDISFNWKDTNISGINGVLGLQSLEPLITNNNQKLFVQNVHSFVPLSNLLFQFYINNQSLRLSNVSGQMADQDIMMSSTLISLKNPNTSVPIKTAENFDLSNLNDYFNLPGIQLKDGMGSFTLPIHITENGVRLDDLVIRMVNSTWQKDKAQSDLLHLFHGSDTGYTVRSGQLILTPNNQLQVALDGWRLPNKEKDSFGPTTVQLSEPLLELGPQKPVPSDIQKLQSKFGM